MTRRRWFPACMILLGILATACPSPTGGEEAQDDEGPTAEEQTDGDASAAPAEKRPPVEIQGTVEADGTFTPISGDCSGFTDTFTYAVDGETTGTVTIAQPGTGQSVSGPIDPATALAEASGEFEQYRLLVPLSDTVVVGGYVHLPEGGCEGEMLVRFDFDTGLCAQSGVPDEECPFGAEPPTDPGCPFDAPAPCAEWSTFYDEQVCDAAGTCPE